MCGSFRGFKGSSRSRIFSMLRVISWDFFFGGYFFKYTIQWCLVYSPSCAVITIDSRMISPPSPINKPHTHQQSNWPSRWVLATANLFSMSMIYLFVRLDSHAMWPSVSGSSRTLYSGFSVGNLLLSVDKQHPSCGYDISLIHSPVEGHLGCFHILATMNTAVMNVCVLCVFVYDSCIMKYP